MDNGREYSLDRAAGYGPHGTIAEMIPHAEIVAVDWPNVLEVAEVNARTHGVAARYSIQPGSAFEADLGDGYDYALLTNILHHFDVSTCERLLRRVHKTLCTGVSFKPQSDLGRLHTCESHGQRRLSFSWPVG